MKEIAWSEQFSVGIAELDSQHRRLVDIINTLIVYRKKGSPQAAVDHLLDEMAGYAKTHFRTEEELFERFGYGDRDRHIRQHNDFIEKITLFRSADGVSSEIISRTMLDYLRQWLVHHILKEDMKYTTFFHERGLQ